MVIGIQQCERLNIESAYTSKRFIAPPHDIGVALFCYTDMARLFIAAFRTRSIRARLLLCLFALGGVAGINPGVVG
jgi:hypothetical protein